MLTHLRQKKNRNHFILQMYLIFIPATYVVMLENIKLTNVKIATVVLIKK